MLCQTELRWVPVESWAREQLNWQQSHLPNVTQAKKLVEKLEIQAGFLECQSLPHLFSAWTTPSLCSRVFIGCGIHSCTWTTIIFLIDFQQDRTGVSVGRRWLSNGYHCTIIIRVCWIGSSVHNSMQNKMFSQSQNWLLCLPYGTVCLALLMKYLWLTQVSKGSVYLFE